MQTSRLIRVAVVAVAACSGCKLLDDDEPPPIDTAGGGTGDKERSCLESVDAVCQPGMDVWLNYSEGASKAILIDDPHATVGVGPGAWLVRVDSESDFVGAYYNDGESCEFACSYCGEGQHACHGGFDEHGLPRCWTCFNYDDPLAGDQCVAFVAACNHGRGDDGEGLDETGAGTTDAIAEYDCATWRPEAGVRRDGSTIVVDAALIEEALLYQGEPLASCDDTRLRRRSQGDFEVSKLASHGLLAAMGLSRGDVFVAIDGEPLNNLDAVMQAAGRLTSAASFTVTVDRGGKRFDLNVYVR
jgi:hypothetical protein